MKDFHYWLTTSEWEVFGQQIGAPDVGIFLAWFLGGLLVSSALQSGPVRRTVTRMGVDGGLVAMVTAMLGVLAFFGGLLMGVQGAGIPIAWDAPVPGISLSMLVIIRLLLLLALVFWLASVLKRFFFRRFLSNSGLNKSLQYTIAQIIGYVALIVGAAIALQNAGIDLSALAILAGAIGVGIGFGLQNIASNFISGIILLIERPVEIGDRIEIEDVAGRVQEIRARSTTVLTNDNIAMIVPNSKLVEDTVTNWTHSDPKVRFRIPVGVAYGSDVAKVEQLLLEVARENEHALAEPAPVVFFNGFGESSLDFELGVWSAQMSYRPRRFRSDLNFAIEQKLRGADIEIPFPQRVVHIRSMPEESPAQKT